jgi:ribosomal protein RSM22 (predicted rRNA methylase)
VTLPEDLLAALAERLRSTAPSRAAAQVGRLMDSYRGTTPTAAPVLRDAADAAAYAAYRMPATYAAVRSALGAFRLRAGDWAPAAHLDLGGGTGAATWAVADTYAEGGHRSTVLDWAQPALDLGAALARGARSAAVREAVWRRQALGGAGRLPGADLVTVSYVLGELTPGDREGLVDAAVEAAAGAVLVVEPGTPEGYGRVLAARERLLAAGLHVLAPCPHGLGCPLAGGDWCHFAARLTRTALHRQVKGGTLGYEDEKFSYVAAARFPAPPGEGAGRVVRHPQTRKGLVILDLCVSPPARTRQTVSKRQGALYHAARAADWGTTWPPT